MIKSVPDPATATLATFDYSLAGIRILSNRRIPEFPRGGHTDGMVEVDFREPNAATALPHEPRNARRPWQHVAANPNAYIHADGRKVVISTQCSPIEYATQVRRVLPFASALQHRMMFHASAIEYGGRAFAFIGASGSGKSTLVRQLSRFGLTPLADDLLACRRQVRHLVVLNESGGTGHHHGTRLAVICFLERGAATARPQLIALSKAQSFQRLLTNGFGELPHPQNWSNQFNFGHQVATEIPAYCLRLPDDVDRIEAMSSWVVKECLEPMIAPPRPADR